MVAKSKQHVLERRANLLAGKLKARISDMTVALQAADGRVPFRTKLSRGTALDFWIKHRYDDLGHAALQGLKPEAVLRLDAELARHNEEQQQQGLPEQQNPEEPTSPMSASETPSGLDYLKMLGLDPSQWGLGQ